MTEDDLDRQPQSTAEFDDGPDELAGERDLDLDADLDVDLGGPFEDSADDSDDVDHSDDSGDAEPVAEPELTSTGDYRVDVAVSRLQELPGLPVADHVALFEDVHAQLQTALADLDER